VYHAVLHGSVLLSRVSPTTATATVILFNVSLTPPLDAYAESPATFGPDASTLGASATHGGHFIIDEIQNASVNLLA
jgi:hypothetical protein